MLNACRFKLNIGIELYRTTKHENAWRVVLSTQVLSKQRKKKGQDHAAQSHSKSTAYKYILRHLHIISFEQVTFCKQKG